MLIVLVEDDHETRKCLSEFLRDHGHSVLETDQASEALKNLEYQQADLIVSDVRMNGTSGLEFLKEVRKVCNTPFILMTAYDDCLELLKQAQLCSAEYLLKPFELDRFAELVELAAKKTAILKE